MSIAFVYIPSSDVKCQSFVELRAQHIKEVESYSDSDYITMIFKHISVVINNTTSTDRQSLRQKSEEEISDYIRRRLKNDEDFSYSGLIVNAEARNQSSIIGYYDLKFEHSYWRDNYFAVECKKIDATEAKSKEYIHKKIYKKSSPSDDGGIYRFVINKYAENKPCGGMFGYVVDGTPSVVVEGLKNKITTFCTTHNGLACGSTINAELLLSEINGFDYGFQSNHTRVNDDQIISPIHLFHMFWDLTN